MIIGSVLMILIIPLILIFAFGIPILLAVLVYRDANKRMDCSPWLWALVAALVPSFIGVIVYLIVRRDYPLKPQYRTYGNGDSQYHSYGQNGQAYEQPSDGSGNNNYGETGYYTVYPQEKTGMPIWAKVLIIIGLIIFAICIICMIAGAIRYITGYHYYSNFNYGF